MLYIYSKIVFFKSNFCSFWALEPNRLWWLCYNRGQIKPIYLNKIYLELKYLVQHAISIVKFSHLANASAKNAFYPRFIHEISKILFWSARFWVTFLKTQTIWFVRVKCKRMFIQSFYASEASPSSPLTLWWV